MRTHLRFPRIGLLSFDQGKIEELEEEIRKLKPYTTGTLSKPGSGYEIIDLSESDEEIIDKKSRDIIDSVIAIRHTRESYVPLRSDFFSPGSSEGERGYQQIRHETEIYWIRPGILAISGPESDANKSLKSFTTLVDGIELQVLSFDPKFLMWLVFRHREGVRDLGHEIEIDFISDAVTVGAIDRMGRITKVRDSTDVSRAIQTVMTMLGGKNLSELICGLSIFDRWRTTVKIESYGRLRFYASSGTISMVDSMTRRVISVVGIKKIVDVYNDWNMMNPRDKFPPKSFFVKMAAEAENEGVIIFGLRLQELVKMYENLRRGGS